MERTRADEGRFALAPSRRSDAQPPTRGAFPARRAARHRLPALCGLLLALGLPFVAPAAEPEAPVARVEAVVDEYFGTRVVDPYRWMEAPENPELKAWMKAQSEHTAAVLGRIAERARLAARIHELSGSTTDVYAFVPAGGRTFYFRAAPGDPAPKVYVRDSLDAPERLLVDPDRYREGDAHAEVSFFEPSKDGLRLAFGIATGGGEWGVLRVLDVATGKEEGEAITRIYGDQSLGAGFTASWLPDNRSFFYTRFPQTAVPAEKQLRSRVYLHRLGKNPDGDGDAAVFGFGLDPKIEIAPESISLVTVAAGARFAVAQVGTVDVDLAGVYVAPLAGTGDKLHWRRLAQAADQIGGVTVHGDDVYLTSRKDAPRYRVLRVDWRRPDLRRAAMVIPQSEVVVQEVQAAADALYVRDLDGGLHRLRRLPYGGGEALAVPLPVQGSMRGPHVAADRPGAIVRLRSWTQPNTIYRYDPAAGTLADLHWQAPAAADFSGVEAREVEVVGHDGTLVPLSIVMRKGTPLDGTHPTLLSSYGAYGGFGTASPYFDPTLLAWIERGGIHAVAHPRGGGEYGEEWHRDGMKLTKLNTVFDTIACAQYLVDSGYASPKTLAIEGASAGGITVGGAINWRPDLFAAAIVHAGISDALRAEFSANGPVNVPEFGSVKDLQGFRGLHAMSPYAHVRAGAAYPAVLLEAGWNDPRVDAWQSGKMAARLQAATASGKPVLLRVDFDSGHFGGTREQSERLLADEWAFLLWQFGDPEFQPAP